MSLLFNSGLWLISDFEEKKIVVVVVCIHNINDLFGFITHIIHKWNIFKFNFYRWKVGNGYRSVVESCPQHSLTALIPIEVYNLNSTFSIQRSERNEFFLDVWIFLLSIGPFPERYLGTSPVADPTIFFFKFFLKENSRQFSKKVRK